MLYVDEFPSFTTEAFASLLPEARKYGLGLALFTQHLGLMPRAVLEAIVGNAGTMMAFRVGAHDAPFIATQFGNLAPDDLLRLPNYHAYAQLMIDGTKSRAFSIATCPPAIGGSNSRATRDG